MCFTLSTIYHLLSNTTQFMTIKRYTFRHVYYIGIYFVYLMKGVYQRSRTPSSLYSTFIIMLRDLEIGCEDKPL